MSEPAGAAPMATGLAAVVTLGVVLVIAGFIVLGAMLGLLPLYAGFLLLWYFGSVDVLEEGALPALAIGAAAGTIIAWGLQAGVAAWGASGALPAVAVIVIAIFCQLRGILPLAINRATMLYVTVLAAPPIQTGERFDRVLIVVAVATIYFGGIVVGAKRIVAARAGRAAPVGGERQ